MVLGVAVPVGLGIKLKGKVTQPKLARQSSPAKVAEKRSERLSVSPELDVKAHGIDVTRAEAMMFSVQEVCISTSSHAISDSLGMAWYIVLEALFQMVPQGQAIVHRILDGGGFGIVEIRISCFRVKF